MADNLHQSTENCPWLKGYKTDISLVKAISR